MQPIYRDLKATIKHMTNTEEYKLMREYIRNRQLILEALPEQSSKAQEGLSQLKTHYAHLLKNQRLRMQKNPSVRLRQMQQRIEDMFRLLNLWSEYVEIIYAPESEINMMKILKDNG